MTLTHHPCCSVGLRIGGTRRRLLRGKAVRPVLAALLFLSHPETAAADQTNWTNASVGDWIIAGNWTNGVPNETASVGIANGGTALLTSDTAKAQYLHVGGPAGNSTLLISKSGLNEGALSVTYDTLVGSDFSGYNGTLRIEKGANFFGGNNSTFYAGSSSLTQGTVSVTDPGSQLAVSSLYIADSGTGSLTVSNGAKALTGYAGIANWPGSSGTVTVTGTGSLWGNLGELFVGGQGGINGGAASVNITAGGQVVTHSLKVFSGGAVSVNNGSTSTAGFTISFADFVPPPGGTLGDVSVGESAAGRMEITSFGLALNQRGYIGKNAGVSGSVLVSGAATRWDCAGSVWVGNSGTGSLEITGGGVVASSGNGYVGFAANSSGTATVSGTGSAWTTALNLYVGGNAAAQGGQGVLQIDNGGVVGAALTTVYSTGFLRLGANPTLNGPLAFLGGFIQTNASNTFNSSFTLGNGGVSVQTTGFTQTLAGNISGPGGLTKFAVGGAGTLKLTGTNTYAGPTAVNAGSLLVNGSITSATTVNSGGTLGGSGTVASVTVNSGGTVAPAGKLTVGGNYNQTAGGALALKIGGYTPVTGYDQLAVTGQATVGGTLNLTLVNKFRPIVGDTFIILSNSAVTGNFTTITGCGFTVRSDATPAGIVLTVTSINPLPVVTNTNDDGPGSLRYLISFACPDSTITFAPGVRGAINLTGGQLVIDKNLTISGPGANLLTVQRGAAAGNSRIFLIASASVTATLSGLTIANGNLPGNSGGGIYNYGTLNLGGVAISGNTANSGGNGGGIFNNFGTVNVICSTLSGNSVSSATGAGSGGAIFNHGGTLTIIASTISGNSAIGPGGNSDSGGGIVTNVGSVTIANSTITANSGDLGGGVRAINGGVVHALSTIIALNTSPSGPDVNGPLVSDGFNLIGNAAGATITTLATDKSGVTSTSLKLGPLADNGGPTKTHALLFNSVAIDQGFSESFFTDQRGFSRPVDYPGSDAGGGDSSDIGAYEYGGAPVLPELVISPPDIVSAVSVTALGASYAVYPVQFSPDLNGNWTTIGNIFTDVSGFGDFQHNQFVAPAPDPKHGFYRLGY